MPTDGFNLSEIETMVNETEYGPKFYKQALLTNNTFQFINTHGDLLINAKMNQYDIPSLEATATMQPSDCGQNSVDTASFDQTRLNMVGFKIEGQFCPQKVEGYFLAKQLPAGQHYEDFNPLQARIMERVGQQIGKKMATFPWYGPTGSDTLTYADSWIETLQGSAISPIGSATITSGGASGTDPDGAFNIAQSIVDVFTDNADSAGEVYEPGAIRIAVSPKFVNLYFQNYRKLFGDNTVVPAMQQLAGGSLTGWQHDGTNVEFVVQNALGLSHHVVASRRETLVFGVDLFSDLSRLDIWYDKTDDLIYWRLKAKAGTTVNAPSVTPPNVVWYGAAS